ncbi:hypothetical protein E2C01_070882 [Portunus trituberculatus]|uniref:Uncharacterized protein n=1 Tax=Portunus trituberculatus TaxID=210409 RepID=A0A5B7I3R0_PORTR|nr:hypothetical protein [Portunus trituberculatus]
MDEGFILKDRFDEKNTRESLLRRRVIHLKDLVKELMARLKIIEKDNEIMKANTEVLKKNYDDLKNKVCASEKKMEDNEEVKSKIIGRWTKISRKLVLKRLKKNWPRKGNRRLPR